MTWTHRCGACSNAVVTLVCLRVRWQQRRPRGHSRSAHVFPSASVAWPIRNGPSHRNNASFADFTHAISAALGSIVARRQHSAHFQRQELPPSKCCETACMMPKVTAAAGHEIRAQWSYNSADASVFTTTTVLGSDVNTSCLCSCIYD